MSSCFLAHMGFSVIVPLNGKCYSEIVVVVPLMGGMYSGSEVCVYDRIGRT